ncbi:hypothetical protein N4T42_12190, partial [Riemerella anatipestifer]|nr:hypothetical protein [Riemerella anatipestifer]MCU7561049.1 hypothetical protein [Riemerella anatipestifer]MDY3450409.1 hypothetical protein [Riemerella anatipestifer]
YVQFTKNPKKFPKIGRLIKRIGRGLYLGQAAITGNFWQGAITGGIVAGLNHEMHKFIENNRIRSALSNPDGSTKQNLSYVEKIKQEVKGLFTKEMIDADNSAMVNEIITGKDSKFSGNTSAKYNESNGAITSKITIEYHNSAFKSNYHLAKTILHEFYHAADYLSNRWSITYYNSKYKSKVRNINNFMTDWAEKRAYQFIYKLGVPESIYNRKHYIKK